MGNFKERMVSGGGLCMTLMRFCMRSLQFFLGVVAAGLYGVRVHSEQTSHLSVDPRWVYGIVVGGTSALTTIIYLLPKVPSRMFFPWDSLICLFWLIVFGIFAKIYLPMQNPTQNPDIARMRDAVWIDLANVLLWFITAVFGAVVFWMSKKGKLPTSRAEV